MKMLLLIVFISIPSLFFGQSEPRNTLASDSMWQAVGNKGFSPGRADYVSLALNHTDIPYVAFADSSNGMKAIVMKFDGTEWINVGNAGLSSGESSYLNLVFSQSSELYLSYIDNIGSGQITVMKFNGTNWVNVGAPGFNASGCASLSMAISSSGIPFVAFADNNKLSVMKYNGISWEYVGTPAFTGTDVDYVNIVISTDNLPYVTFKDLGLLGGAARVIKFDGNGWVELGPYYWAAGISNWNKLAFDNSGELYVAYQQINSAIVGETVRRFDGTNWPAVGIEHFFSADPEYTSLCFNPLNNQPYVALCKNWFILDGAASVLKFDGINWIYVGPENISNGKAKYTNLVFSSSGIPYLAFMDGANANKTTVMKFDATGVGIENPQNSYFTIFPNPVATSLKIILHGVSDKIKVLEIINSHGIIVFSGKYSENEISIDISKFPAGIYCLRMKTNTSIHTEQIIKL
jgi:hypothetical protein